MFWHGCRICWLEFLLSLLVCLSNQYSSHSDGEAIALHRVAFAYYGMIDSFALPLLVFNHMIVSGFFINYNYCFVARRLAINVLSDLCIHLLVFNLVGLIS